MPEFIFVFDEVVAQGAYIGSLQFKSPIWGKKRKM